LVREGSIEGGLDWTKKKKSAIPLTIRKKGSQSGAFYLLLQERKRLCPGKRGKKETSSSTSRRFGGLEGRVGAKKKGYPGFDHEHVRVRDHYKMWKGNPREEAAGSPRNKEKREKPAP